MNRIHPGLPGAVVRTNAELYAENGELRRGLHWTLPPETIEEFRQGYRCALPPHGCGAAQQEAFPEKCIEPYCDFNLKRDLSLWLAMAFEGEETLWPEQPADEERNQWRAARGLWLPPGTEGD
jgi:hypothetical protein